MNSDSDELESVLMHFSLGLMAFLILLFILRIVKIIFTKKAETKEDICCVLFLIILIIPFVCLYDYLKEKFKKVNKKV